MKIAEPGSNPGPTSNIQNPFITLNRRQPHLQIPFLLLPVLALGILDSARVLSLPKPVSKIFIHSRIKIYKYLHEVHGVRHLALSILQVTLVPEAASSNFTKALAALSKGTMNFKSVSNKIGSFYFRYGLTSHSYIFIFTLPRLRRSLQLPRHLSIPFFILGSYSFQGLHLSIS